MINNEEKNLKKAVEQSNQRSPYYWEWNNIKEEIEESDKAVINAKDFRLREATEIVNYLSKGQTVVFVRANSGFGVSKFLIPTIEQLLASEGKKASHAEILEESYIKYAEELGDVFIVDEIGQSSGGWSGGFNILVEIMKKRPDLQVVLIFDDRSTDLRNDLKKLEKTGLVSRVEMSQKLLSIEQATDIAQNGAPFKHVRGAKGTLFEGLTRSQSKKIIEVFANKHPLHFRLIEILRWSGANYDWSKNKPISFEDRLKMVEKGDEIDYKIEEKLSWDPMGIKRRPIKK